MTTKPRKEKTRLTPRDIQALKPRAIAYDTMDTDVRAFGVRTQTTGEKSFILYRRYPGSTVPARRTLAHVGEMTLSDARELARDWISLCKKGIDPRRAAEQEREANIEAERSRRVNTIKSVLESYYLDKAGLRSIAKLKVTMQRELAPWLDRSILDIRTQDVKDLIRAIQARGKTSQAQAVYRLVNAFLAWTVQTGDYGLEVSPCAKINAFTLVGRTKKITRVLDDDELRAYWRAAEILSYPYGHFFRFVALTALRRDEAGEASWNEIDLGAKRFIIPHDRMKAKPGADHRPHLVPIVPQIEEFLRKLPRHVGGDLLFSETGAKPIAGYGRAKAKVHALMCADLKAIGHKPPERWTIHDIRRTCRTRFSSLGIPEHIGERLLAHAVPEIEGRYNLYGAEREKAAALITWHKWLSDLIDPRPALRVVA